jgi:hypothetical protein
MISFAMPALWAALLVALVTPCHAASAEAVVDTLLTTRYLERETCNGLGMIGTQLLQELGQQELGQRPAKAKPAVLSRQQVRRIAADYDAINLRLCASVMPLVSARDGWVRSYRQHGAVLGSRRLDNFLSDELVVKWAPIAAGFRAELLMLNSVIELELGLRGDAFNPGTVPLVDLQSPAMRDLLREIRLVSLTDEEARARFVLATLLGHKSFREMMPPRFDLDRLARIEAKTRRLGLQFVRSYGINLQSVYDTRTRLLVLSIDDRMRAPAVANAVRMAAAQVAALASRYRAK